MAVIEVKKRDMVDAPSIWGDWHIIEIDRSATTYPVAFRWATELANATGGVFQASRVPFPAGGANWTSPPGLAVYGKVERNGDTWETFTIDMAKAANRPTSAGALVQGAVSKTWTFPVGFGWLEVALGSVELGPVSFPYPKGLAYGKEEKDLPGTAAECKACLIQGPATSSVTDLLLSINQTFYVRVVPVDADGRIAGNPSIPVEVTVMRPDGAPAIGYTTTHVLRPPSVRIVSYDPIRETAEPYHFYVVKGSALWPKGGHFYDPPDESTCDSPYVTDGDCWIQAANAIDDALEMVTGALATTWQMLQDFVVDVAIRTTILGPLGCDESDACRGFLKTTLQVVMISCGVPPTLPSYVELKDAGAEYMTELALQEMGAGEAYDALPEEMRNEIKAKGKAAAGDLISSFNSETDDRIGLDFIPDPEYLPHPGLVMLRVSNPNGEPTDPCVVSVGDSLGFYRAGSAVLPSLAPGQSFAVPVSLEENIDAFATPQTCPVEVTAAGYCTDCAEYKGVWQSNYGDMYRFCTKANWKTSLVRATEDRVRVSLDYPDRHVSVGTDGPVLPPTQNFQTISVTYPPGWQVAIAPPLAVDPDQQSAAPHNVFKGGFRNTGE